MNPLLRFLMKVIDSGQGRYVTTVHGVQVESWIGSWIFPFLVAAIIGGTYYLYSREKRLKRKQRITLIVLRSLAYLALLGILALSVIVIEGEGALPGPVPVIIDGSESMLIKDSDGKARSETALKIADYLKANNPYKDLHIKTFWSGKDFKKLKDVENTTPDADYTSINRMLEKGIDNYLGEYCPGVVLISDGGHNSAEIVDNSLAIFQDRNIPVYTCGVGKERSKDIAVTYILGEDVVFIDEKAKIYVNLRQYGYTGKQVNLQLYLGDKRVYTGLHDLDKEGEISVPVEYVPTTKGYYSLKAEVSPHAAEITVVNNVFVKNLRVIDEKIKALMVFGMPSWEYRYLAGAFERDKRVELKSYLLSVDTRVFRRAKSKDFHFVSKLPRTREELNRSYDVVFLSRIDANVLPREFLKALSTFVREDGGSVAMLSDPYFIPYTLRKTPMEDLVPVTIEEDQGRSYRDELFSPIRDPMKLTVTEDGNAHQLVAFSGVSEENRKIWEELPPIYSFYKAGRVKPSSISLLVMFRNRNRQHFPAIVYHAYGKGTVLFMAFDSTWRWRREHGDRYFRDYWGKAVQFLGLPHLLNEAAQSAIFVGRENCSVGDRVSVRAKISNPDYSPYMGDDVELTITENDVSRKLKMNAVAGRPGIYRGVFVPAMAGEQQLSLSARFSARPIDLRVVKKQKEFNNAGMDRKVLEHVATATRGEFCAADKYQKILETLWKNRARQPIKVSATIWDTLLLLLVSMVFFSLEWYSRKIYYLDS